ncbi:MAG: chromosome segregation protein SMC, partial [Veillonella sp.]|nr:chromosome segregation protein SMC [Veillonella sp.]
MQLLRLEMKGFKSFADRTVVKFSPGMTAIVGPNGSGKSNVTDAMRWVLGESNVRNLRGQKAEDIIFSGTVKRRPLGAAEATLVFDNSDGTLDIDMAEVAITRRIYRSGESEFMINKRKCRLKDVHMLLADTGLGKDSMAIIGQNRIDAILNSKPEERRLIFEDVAGISRFKLNKEDALRRIAATERNMERVGDVMSTLEDQLGPLEEKAEKTRQYMELSRAKREFDGALGYHAYKTADRLFTRFENDNLAYQDEDIQLQTELSKLEAQRQELQLAASKGQEQLKAWEAEFARLQREEERLAGELRLVEEQLKAAEREAQDAQTRISELEATKSAEGQQVLILDKLIADDSALLASYEGQLAGLEEAYTQAREKVAQEQAKLQAFQDQVDSRQEQHMALMRSMEAKRLEISHNQGEASRIEDQILALQGEVEEDRQNLQATQADKAQKEKQFQEAQSQCQALREREQAMTRRMRDNQKLLQKAQSDMQKAQGRLEVLEQWADQHEGYMEGTKNVLNGKGPWRQDIKGAVGDLFKVEDRFVTAIETALGGAVNHVVTSTAQAASQAVRFLKETQGGRVTFLPMETVQGKITDTPALQEAGVLGRAVDCLDFDGAYTNIFQYLLGRTLVVETMDQAIQIQKKYKQSLRIVTLTGEQFQPGGSLTGGATKRRKASVLSRKEEAQRLEKDLAQWQEQVAQWRKEMAEDEAQIDSVRQELQEWDQKRQHLHLLHVSSETKLANEAQQLSRKEETIRTEGARKETLLASVESLTQALDQDQADLDALVAAHDGGDSTAAIMAALPGLQQAQ